MGILDTFRANKEKEKEKKGEHKTPPARGHVLAEILQDKKKSDLFGKLLKEGGSEGEELAKRMAEGKLEESDIALLEEKRLLFSEKIAASEKVEKLLTKETVIDLARNHPEFEKIVNLVGPEKAIKAIQGQLKELAITDVARFESITSAVRDLEIYKTGEYKEVNNEVEKFLEEKGINPKEYSDVLAIEDPIEKGKALKEMARKYGGRWFGRLNNELLLRLQNTETSLEDAIKGLNTQQSAVADVLFASVAGNESVRKSFFTELLNEKAPEKPEMGFREAKKGTFNNEKFKKNWEKFKRKESYDGAPDDAARDHIKDLFIEEQRNSYKKENEGKGFWVTVFEAMFDNMIANKKAELK